MEHTSEKFRPELSAVLSFAKGLYLPEINQETEVPDYYRQTRILIRFLEFILENDLDQHCFTDQNEINEAFADWPQIYDRFCQTAGLSNAPDWGKISMQPSHLDNTEDYQGPKVLNLFLGEVYAYPIIRFIGDVITLGDQAIPVESGDLFNHKNHASSMPAKV